MTKNYNAVREGIVAAVPGIQETTFDGEVYVGLIGLEDVLRAIPTARHYLAVDSMGHFLLLDLRSQTWRLADAQWTLGLPLDQQPEAVIDFLYQLLSNKV